MPENQPELSIDNILQKVKTKSKRTNQQKGVDDIVLELRSDEENEVAAVSAQKLNLADFFRLSNEWLIERSGVSLREKLEFVELLATVINAGVSVNESLQLLRGQTKNPKLKNVILDLQARIEDGYSLADAMRKNDDVFDEATCAIIQAGEKSGKLIEVLMELSNQYSRLYTLKRSVMSVMLYPVIVFSVMILLSIVVIMFVIPRMATLFGGAENLPTITKLFLNTSDFMLNQYVFIFVALVTIFMVTQAWTKSSVGKMQWALMKLNIPFFGSILKGMILSRVTRIFGFLISSGVPIIESLRIASAIAENPIYQEKLILAADDLGKGIPIAENLSDNEKLFPRMLVNMISVGEKSASLETVMSKVADFYDTETQRKIKNLSKVMEPFILAFIAVGVVLMLLAVYMPILQMNEHILG